MSGLFLSGMAQTVTAAETQTITVTATAKPPTPVSGFIADRAISGTKTDTAVLDTPQSISVITRDQMTVQGTQSLGYTAGIMSDMYGDDNVDDGVLVRGTEVAQYVDGLGLLNSFSNAITRPDPYTFERIEVLRGLSGMLYGQGVLGGIINIVSKRPQPVAAHEIGVNVGNYQHKSVQVGVARTRGAELEVRASVKNLDLIGTYTYLDAKVTKGNPGEQGNQLANVPQNMASFWANYHFSVSGQPGFLVGAGVRYNGSKSSHYKTSDYQVAGVTLYDAVIGYDHGPWRLALNASNLFNKEYITRCAYNTCFFGTHRTIIASASYRF